MKKENLKLWITMGVSVAILLVGLFTYIFACHGCGSVSHNGELPFVCKKLYVPRILCVIFIGLGAVGAFVSGHILMRNGMA